ncbi:glycosyltransferase family 2 protein [Maridesulfovibrio salexigens]|uniref:Glycosyl transferase family 2 n=1 Tax=Maridesulfovibrio salexigens (strain ATCC 14822 / DSM 2638 / NCIMB 8403 / VKM B-1763) TaxID=526222 RepID=C6C104_MARSD|nr:glycosyltransferase family 2 protein [Maridesulfovibrio salexigens]ACS79167.1 glycosyl transferase family 2 [Maridesulfovibrio salexigens DSM 2638]
MGSPKVSVTMPCYNCESTVGEAIDSILGQTFENLELLAVDDGSEDNTAQILKKYAARDPRLKPIFLEHQGVVGAANAAINAASGSYIARMDADDLALPERIEKQAELLDCDHETGLTACRVGFGGDREKNGGYAHYVDWINTLVDADEISLNRFVEFPFANPSIMARKELIEKHGPFRDGDFPEDYELVLRWLEAGVKMRKVDEELLIWNDPPDRLSRNHPKYTVEAFYRIKSEYLFNWLQNKLGPNPKVGIIGSGRTSRKRYEILESLGVETAFYVDVDPRKIGMIIHGKKVIGRNELPPAGEIFLLSYVASWGARDEVAEFLDTRGFVMGRDYLLAS